MCVFNILRNAMYVYGLVLLFPIIPECQVEATNYATTVNITRPMIWIEANSNCRNSGGSLLDLAVIARTNPTLDVLFWTAETIKLNSQGDSCADAKWLCGIIQLTQYYTTDNALFGDCNTKRLYACRDSHDLPTPETTYVRLCSVYRREIGQVYTSCLNRHYALCLSAKQSTPKKTIWSTIFRTTPPATRTQQPDSEPATVQFVSTIGASVTVNSNNAAETSTNIGVKIGVPIAVSLVVFCGAILAIVFIRRRQTKHNLTNDDSRHNVRRSRTSGNDYHSQALEHSGTDGRNIVGNDVYNVCEDPDNNQISKENDEYSFVKTPEEPELHIYDHTSQDNEQYDTITPKIQTDIQSDSVYNHLAGVEKEDVYDSTIQESCQGYKSLTMCTIDFK